MYKYLVSKYTGKRKDIVGVEYGFSLSDVKNNIEDIIRYDYFDDAAISEAYKIEISPIPTENNQSCTVSAQVVDQRGMHLMQRKYNIEVVKG